MRELEDCDQGKTEEGNRCTQEIGSGAAWAELPGDDRPIMTAEAF